MTSAATPPLADCHRRSAVCGGARLWVLDSILTGRSNGSLCSCRLATVRVHVLLDEGGRSEPCSSSSAGCNSIHPSVSCGCGSLLSNCDATPMEPTVVDDLTFRIRRGCSYVCRIGRLDRSQARHLTTRWSESAAGSFDEGRGMLHFWIKWLRCAAEMPRFAQRGR